MHQLYTTHHSFALDSNSTLECYDEMQDCPAGAQCNVYEYTGLDEDKGLKVCDMGTGICLNGIDFRLVFARCNIYFCFLQIGSLFRLQHLHCCSYWMLRSGHWRSMVKQPFFACCRSHFHWIFVAVFTVDWKALVRTTGRFTTNVWLPIHLRAPHRRWANRVPLVRRGVVVVWVVLFGKWRFFWCFLEWFWTWFCWRKVVLFNSDFCVG